MKTFHVRSTISTHVNIYKENCNIIDIKNKMSKKKKKRKRQKTLQELDVSQCFSLTGFFLL